MDNTLRKQINELAETVLDVFDISRPITNMNNVINILGGEIREDASLGLFSDGKVYKEKDNSKGFSFYIVVPSNQPDARKNFTVAHELGHLFLHMGYKINDELWAKSDDVVFNRRGNSEIELQANEFAAAFLMPKSEYKRVMDEYSKGDTVFIDKVAEYFNVSIDAASYRGKWLGYLQW